MRVYCMQWQSFPFHMAARTRIRFQPPCPVFLTLNVDADAVGTALDQLSTKLNATKETWTSKLEDYIDQAGHYSYAREIKEILEDEEAGV